MNSDTQLFELADITRDKIDITEQKNILLPLAFYRLADAVEEEIEIELPENYKWSDLSEQTTDIAEWLDEAYQKLEEENQAVKQPLATENFSQKNHLGDKTLRRLITKLDGMNIEKNKEDVVKSFDNLVTSLVQAEGRDGGMYHTPKEISMLVSDLLKPLGDSSVHDPTCGAGGTLASISDAKEHDASIDLTGQEINPSIAPIAEARLLLRGEKPDIRKGDSLAEPQFVENNKLQTFDYVVSDFPYSADWPKEELKEDEHNRFFWTEKLPRADRGDYAFLYHQIAHLNNSGKSITVAPQGMLFRKHESDFRQALIEQDIIEAVIALPENLFQHVTIPANILVINKDKPEEREGEILVIDASRGEFYEELRTLNRLTEEGINRIVEMYDQWQTEERVSRIVETEEIEKNDYNLNTALYIDTTEPVDTGNVNELVSELEDVTKEQKNLSDKLLKKLEVIKNAE